MAEEKNVAELCRIRKHLESENAIIIPRLVVVVTNRCTLKCEQCSMLIPYFNEYKDESANEVICDLIKILNVIDECVVLEFIGGEPFLYKELGTLIQFAQYNSKIKMIEITTNATLIPDERLLQILSNEKTILLISDYQGINMQKMSAVKRIFEENKVNYRILEMNKWNSYGGIKRRKRSTGKLTYSFYHCCENELCRTLFEGKVFVCGRAAALYELGKLTDDSSYLEIRDNDKLSGRDIKNFYLEKKYAEACDFCDGYRDIFKQVEVAKQCNRSINNQINRD